METIKCPKCDSCNINLEEVSDTDGKYIMYCEDCNYVLDNYQRVSNEKGC
jgi:uncharacterized C2H2 Zn-finger protein